MGGTSVHSYVPCVGMLAIVRYVLYQRLIGILVWIGKAIHAYDKSIWKHILEDNLFC